jgi:NAD(P)-dependent dehydrogenase (short-subunit alcohol dehydrogenase family)
MSGTQGKVVVITGSSSGIGEATALLLMPPWTHQLTEPQRQQLVDYVRSLFPASEQDGEEYRTAAGRQNP